MLFLLRASWQPDSILTSLWDYSTVDNTVWPWLEKKSSWTCNFRWLRASERSNRVVMGRESEGKYPAGRSRAKGPGRLIVSWSPSHSQRVQFCAVTFRVVDHATSFSDEMMDQTKDSLSLRRDWYLFARRLAAVSWTNIKRAMRKYYYVIGGLRFEPDWGTAVNMTLSCGREAHLELGFIQTSPDLRVSTIPPLHFPSNYWCSGLSSMQRNMQ